MPQTVLSSNALRWRSKQNHLLANKCSTQATLLRMPSHRNGKIARNARHQHIPGCYPCTDILFIDISYARAMCMFYLALLSAANICSAYFCSTIQQTCIQLHAIDTAIDHWGCKFKYAKSSWNRSEKFQWNTSWNSSSLPSQKKKIVRKFQNAMLQCLSCSIDQHCTVHMFNVHVVYKSW